MKLSHRQNPERILGQLLNDVTSTTNSNATVEKTMYSAVVVSTDDPKNSNRIKVSIPGIDDGTPINDLPWCLSMMPAFFYNMPMKNELVFVYMQNPWNIYQGRYWIGPIMTENNTNEEQYDDVLVGLGLIKPERT